MERYRIWLTPDRDMELIALRMCKTLDFSTLARAALQAYVKDMEYRIVIPRNAEFVERPLRCSVTLDPRTDSDVIRFMRLLKVSKTNAIKNIMLMSMDCRPEVTYLNERLNELLVGIALNQPKEIKAERPASEEEDEVGYWNTVAASMRID